MTSPTTTMQEKDRLLAGTGTRLRYCRPHGEPHLMAARRTLIDANCCVASLRKPLDTLDLHHFAAAARRPFSRAGHQQTFKYRHWPIQTATSETLGSLTCSASFGCFGYFNEVPGVDVVDVAVNRNMLCDERMLTDAAYVLNHA
jgi:hypothetical protein